MTSDEEKTTNVKTTGKSIKWIICSSQILSKLFFNKIAITSSLNFWILIIQLNIYFYWIPCGKSDTNYAF